MWKVCNACVLSAKFSSAACFGSLQILSAPFALLSKSIECEGTKCKWFSVPGKGPSERASTYKFAFDLNEDFSTSLTLSKEQVTQLGSIQLCFRTTNRVDGHCALGNWNVINCWILSHRPSSFGLVGKDASGNFKLSRKIRIPIKLCCLIVDTSTFRQF